MVLNYIWIGFFVIAFIVGAIKAFVFGEAAVFPDMMLAVFDSAKTGFELALGLTGIMTLWMGIMKVGEAGGVVKALARAVAPLFSRLFKGVPKDHPAHGSIAMNMAANMMGLDNAATPIGLKAMNELQELNPNKDTASNAQIMFMVLNASGLTIIPITIMMYRAQMGAANPADVFIPILIATFCSTLAGIIAVSLFQRINLLKPIILIYLGSVTLIISGITWFFASLPPEKVNGYSLFGANFFIFLILILFISVAALKKINVYETFIEGAKEGFQIAIRVIPYLVAILVAIAVFRASGAMDYIMNFFASLGTDKDVVNAMPSAIMKPLSGSGARGMMLDSMETFGADSFTARLSCMFQGAADTTFYILAVYFGSVGIRKTRHALACALIADLAGLLAAIFVAYMMFG
ncbi:MAG: hypothetical protein A2W91_18640 [Bacteroidetes bacterium GWF2_38_335]|nr:MAG: hypothetical protein A2W91_18640 [Bacteroidetes bacterium GWF2_38_335]OFY78177.1 MAG: hypothetical protein A2281_04425 [Bacteroidetes bacterium RIFOXYA12_FULL_38_20]HBS88660.1 hypothetical protein [Bacteroidales bacterium]